MSAVLTWIGIAVLAGIVLLLIWSIYLSVVLKWEDEQTRGLGYYGRPLAERERFKRKLRVHARLLYPILRLMGRSSKFTFEKVSFRHRGLAGPRGSCTPESFAQADRYQPRGEDVFVVTQMKCGTTWMQHLVYEVIHRGRGNLVDTGTALYAVSPWIEGAKSVPVDQAPVLGSERPTRIVKTHLPVSHCPWNAGARYLYVARHPVSCFASCADFIATNVGAMAPPLAVVEEWFCSRDAMWWGTWTDHVKGWWDRAQGAPNVLFLHFEDMKADLGAVVRRVTDFLGVAPLTSEELARVVEKCGFAYMQRHQEAFEMNPPHILQTDAELFVRGSADRHRDVPEEVRRRVAEWSRREMAGHGYPLLARYPDLDEGSGFPR
jgi:hypothetical protein